MAGITGVLSQYENFPKVPGDQPWSVADLSAMAGAPVTSIGAIAGYAWSQGGTKQVVYVDDNGHIQELVVGLIHTSTPPEVEPLHRASYGSRVFQRKCPEMAFLSLPLAPHGMH